MKRLLLLTFAALLLAGAAAAADIDGKWVAEFQQPARTQGGEARTVQVILDLKAAGGELQGSVSIAGRRRAPEMPIQNGRIEGNRFSFTTVQKTQKGENRVEWKGAVEDGQLKGTRGREGARRALPFTAKRQS